MKSLKFMFFLNKEKEEMYILYDNNFKKGK